MISPSFDIGKRVRLVAVTCGFLFALYTNPSASLAETNPSPMLAGMNLAGNIQALIQGGLSLNSGSACGYVPIYITRSTRIILNGQRLAAGVSAQVIGRGSCVGVTATQITLSGGATGVPKHILTGDYLGSPYGSSRFNWSTYARWLSWAEVSNQDANGVASAGIRTLMYTNPNRQQPGDPMYTSDESTFAHDCSGSRISNRWNANMNLMNPLSVALRGLWDSVVSNAMSQGHFDAIFSDDADDVYGTTALPCRYNPGGWLAATNAQQLSLGRPVIYNGLGILSAGYGVSDAIGLNISAIGGMMEGCYSQPGPRPKPQGAVWRTIENTELIMAAQNKLFLCYANNVRPAASAVDDRIYTYASFLLTYNIRSSLLWEYFLSPSKFHVQPETALVATAPLLPAPRDISGLQRSSGVYAREYAACYVFGSAVGPCAAVVNPDTYNSRAFPFTKYHHTLYLTGGGALDGGTVSTRGYAPPSVLGPLGSAIAFL